MMHDDGDWQPLHEGRGARLVLPPRGQPIFRVIGTALMMIGLVGVVAAVNGIYMHVWPPSTLDTRSLMRAFIALIFCLWFGWVFLSGLFVAFGHAELILTDDAIIGVDRCGPVHYSRRVALSSIEHIEVISFPGLDLATLQIARRHRKPTRHTLWLLLGYPRARVEAIHAGVRARLGREGTVEFREAESAAVRIERVARVEWSPVLEQPAQSRAVVARTAEGLMIELPALGFFRGSKGLGLFSILWLTFVGIIGAVILVVTAESEPRNVILPGFVIALFVAVGLAFFVWALRSGKRRGIIRVADGTLTIVKQSLGPPVSHSWPRAELRNITLGPSGMVNGRPLLELQVNSTKGGTIGLFVERDDGELAWIATELSTALELELER